MRLLWTLIALVAWSPGCTSTRTSSWSGRDDAGELSTFLAPDVVGHAVDVKAEGRRVRGRIVAVDLESEKLWIETESSAFESSELIALDLASVDSLAESEDRISLIKTGVGTVVLAGTLALLHAYADAWP